VLGSRGGSSAHTWAEDQVRALQRRKLFTVHVRHYKAVS
jgi:hypothetical protein